MSSMVIRLPRLRRKPTRRQQLAHRVDEIVGWMSWRVTRWWTRGFGNELRRLATRR
jgi:hypothetical protein